MKQILEKDVKRCAQQLLYDYDKQAIDVCEFPKVLLFCAEYMDSELVGECKERLEYIAREILCELKFDIYVEDFEENPKYNSIEQCNKKRDY
ncbi:hypothetical protein SAMN02910358_01554 [Lachnospiraceae bacterium XBB1006]|nr:hypothetical protein SAMN02910358_01554 [Lachnospiraceae bacterium XBB1006]